MIGERGGGVELEYIPSFRDQLHADIKPSFIAHSFRDEHDAKMMYGLPKVKKFPMPDAKHVRSAIKFFNYAKPSQEQELATAILARMNDYGIDPDDINIGDDNRFKKYLQHSYLAHHGIKGMHWGVRRYQNPDGSLTSAGAKRYNKQVSKQDKIADKGDKLRAKGITLDGGLALTKGQRAAGLAGVAGAGALQFAVPATSSFPMLGVASTLMAMDVQNRKAIQASIAREKRTKMKEVRKQNAERQRKLNRQLKAVKKDREDAFKKVYGKKRET